MSAVVLARLRDLFLAPAEGAPARRVAERAMPSSLAVLASPGDADVAGAAVALVAARGLGAACAVACVWRGAGMDACEASPGGDAGGEAARPAALASAAARRLCGRLVARGLAATARGRLVRVVLPAAPGEARAAAERTLAAAGDAPVVLVVAGARPAAFDALLGGMDRVLVVPAADAPAGLASLAVDAAARVSRSAALLDLPLPASAAARALAASGAFVAPSLRAAAGAALGGDRG